MWPRPHRSAEAPADDCSSCRPVLCLLYEDEPEAQEMLDRAEKAGLSGIPTVMIGLEPPLPKLIPLVNDTHADNRATKPVKVA